MTNIEWHHIDNGYTMKVRIYPNKDTAAIFESYFIGLEKAANITLWELKQHNLEICTPDKDDPNVFWPDFYAMAKKSWLDKLREENPLVGTLPGSALSSQVGGLFLFDMKKAWEKQGKLPVDIWFSKTNKKGKCVLSFYGSKKHKNSYFLQIPAQNFELDEAGRIYVTIPKVKSRMRVRGWYENITFGECGLSFFDYYKNDPTHNLTCRVTKNNIGEFYLTIMLQDVNRRYKVSDHREPIGIDVNIKTDAGVVSSKNGHYENRRFKESIQDKDEELDRKLSRRYGMKNKDYRDDCKKVRRENKNLPYEKRKPLPSESNRYKKADMQKKKLNMKTARRRNYYQHQISAQEVGSASLLGIETLNVKSMLKDDQLSSGISDAAFYAQLKKLEYKGKWAGIPVMKADKYYASSHICPTCGYKFEGDEKFGLSVREFDCPQCGSHWDVDDAAAQNLKNTAIYMHENPQEFEKKEKERKTKKWVKPPDKPIDKAHPDILISYNENIQKVKGNPYIVIDINGNVIDDAQGYGYSTAQKASKAYRYKYLQKTSS